MNINDYLEYPYDPWLILGVSENASDKDVKKAWKKNGSPETGYIYKAYELLKDYESRRKILLLGPKPFRKTSEALNTLKKHPQYLGPEKWLYQIRNK